jgi:hypothetical protein
MDPPIRKHQQFTVAVVPRYDGSEHFNCPMATASNPYKIITTVTQPRQMNALLIAHGKGKKKNSAV